MEEKKDIVITIDDLMNQFKSLNENLLNVYNVLTKIQSNQIEILKKIDDLSINNTQQYNIPKQQMYFSNNPIAQNNIDNVNVSNQNNIEEVKRKIKEKQKEILLKNNPALREPQWTGEVIGDYEDLKKGKIKL